VCGLPDSGMWVAGSRPEMRGFGSVFGCEKWRVMGGGVLAVVVMS